MSRSMFVKCVSGDYIAASSIIRIAAGNGDRRRVFTSDDCEYYVLRSELAKLMPEREEFELLYEAIADEYEEI